MNNKLQTKDLINLGLFTVLYFVIGCCVAIPIGFVPIFLPVLGSLWSLITGIPFMLFLTRVKKFGMVTIMGVLSGLLMGLTGMGFWGVPMGLIFGLLGDLILKSGDYKSAKKSILGYAVFSLWMVGTYIPMYFMVEDRHLMGMGQTLSREIHRQHCPCGIRRSLPDGALFLCSSYCYADVVRGSEFFALYSSLCYCALRLFGKSHILKSFHNNFSHSDLLHAARSPGEYYRKTGPRPDGEDFRYSVRSV